MLELQADSRSHLTKYLSDEIVNYKKFDAVSQLTGGQKPSESLH